MGRHTVGLEPGDEFSHRIFRSALGPSVHVDLDGLTVVAYDADQLERYGEQILTAARDLRMAGVDTQEAKSLSQMFDGTDNTAAAAAFVSEKNARREALRQQREAS